MRALKFTSTSKNECPPRLPDQLRGNECGWCELPVGGSFSSGSLAKEKICELHLLSLRTLCRSGDSDFNVPPFLSTIGTVWLLSF
jgi:hypothetical protein